MLQNIDEEWENFITESNEDCDDEICSDAYYAASNNNNSTSNDACINDKINKTMNFSNLCTTSVKKDRKQIDIISSNLDLGDVPCPSDIYISTKSMIEYLNHHIDNSSPSISSLTRRPDN